MRKVSLFLVVFSLVFLPLDTGRSQGQEARNAYWWEPSSRLFKLGYVGGYARGMRSAQQMIDGSVVLDEIRWTSEPAHSRMLRMMEFGEITFGQYVDGLDQFYVDFRNKRILFDYAVLYVRDQIRGFPQAELDDRLAAMRAATSQQDYDQR